MPPSRGSSCSSRRRPANGCSLSGGFEMQLQAIDERSIRRSALLSSMQMEKAIPPQDVIRVLNGAKISFVLVGAYGLAGWKKEARATEDVDVVVAAKQVKRAVKVLCKAFPHLEPVDLPVVVRLRV